LRQRPRVDIANEVFSVLKMFGTVGGARREACVIVERLVMRLEVEAALVARIDDLALFPRRLPAVCKRAQ
jgi:hypothetical protein